MLTITNEDNMVMMARYPAKYFDLAIVDPPYGIGIDGQKKSINKNPKHNRKLHEKRNWDNNIPDESYFNELFRVSKHQIVFGGNYFTEHLPPVKSWIFWYKGQTGLTMSDGELLWTSLPIVTRMFTVNRANLIKQNTIHPTEKPYKIYQHLLTSYAKPGDKILDTHLGSGSIAVVCDHYGFDLTACEMDEKIFADAMKRIKDHTAQTKLF